MGIKRYFADIDNTITNAYEYNLKTRATGANMGQSDILETFSIYAQASTSSSELARFLIQFPTVDVATDRTAGTIPASGSVSFFLKLYNAPHTFTVPKNYTMAIRAVSGSWEEGHGLDMDNYTDLVYENPGSNWIFANNDRAAATATLTVADGDAASGMAEKEYITIISTDGTTKRYVLTNAASDSATATGTVLSDSDNTDTGAGTAGADEDGGIAVSINLSSATQNDYLVQLKAAIEHANGHNGKITVSAVPGAADGNQSITLTQATQGRAGNTTITTDISQITKTNFTSGDGKWVNEGGDFWTGATSNFTKTFDTGTEDLEIDVTTLVEQWVNSAGNVLGYKPNHGFGVMLTSSHEAETRSYYTKKFFGRGTEFWYKRPVLEARWDSARQDDRGNFYYSSSLMSGEDNMNTLYMYNYVRGKLRDIPAVSTNAIYVSVFSGSADDTAPGGSALELVVDGTAVTHSARKTIVTGSHVSTGIYKASFCLTSAATPVETLYDIWWQSTTTGASYAESTKFFTGSLSPKTLYASRINPTNTRYTTITNLRPKYLQSETARFRLFIREKDWSPTIYTKASTAIEGSNVVSGSYRVYRVVDELDVIPYGTGSNLHTVMSYDTTGSYFDLDMSMLQSDYAYAIEFSYYNDGIGSWVKQPEVFKFRVE